MSPRKKLPPGKPPKLTDLEERVMNVLWRLGRCTSAELIEAYCQEEIPLAETTIRTVLSKLREKGYVSVSPATERKYLYKPAVSRETVVRGTLKSYLRRLMDGSPKEAIAYLLESESLTDKELAEIRTMLDAHLKRRQ